MRLILDEGRAAGSGPWLLPPLVELGYGIHGLLIDAEDHVAGFEILGRGTARIDIGNDDAMDVRASSNCFRIAGVIF